MTTDLDEFFTHLALDYDWQTRLLSLGFDRRWRKFTAQCIKSEPGDIVLELACGTGEMANSIIIAQPHLQVYALDNNPAMLAVAHGKLKQTPIFFMLGNAYSLPFTDSFFKAVVVSFGLRIVQDRQQMLTEIKRVLKPGGRAYFLETAPFSKGFAGRILQTLRPIIISALQYLAPGWQGYRYLLDSMLDLPLDGQLHDILKKAGLLAPRSYALSPPLARLHIAEKYIYD